MGATDNNLTSSTPPGHHVVRLSSAAPMIAKGGTHVHETLETFGLDNTVEGFSAERLTELKIIRHSQPAFAQE